MKMIKKFNYKNYFNKKKIYQINYDKNSNLLSYFYGEDKSYRQGCPFDDGDFIVEFNFIENNNGYPIDHHPLSFRGAIRKKEINIVGIYVNNRKDYFVSELALKKHKQNITNLIEGLTNSEKIPLNFYDELHENNFSNVTKK